MWVLLVDQVNDVDLTKREVTDMFKMKCHFELVAFIPISASEQPSKVRRYIVSHWVEPSGSSQLQATSALYNCNSLATDSHSTTLSQLWKDLKSTSTPTLITLCTIDNYPSSTH